MIRLFGVRTWLWLSWLMCLTDLKLVTNTVWNIRELKGIIETRFRRLHQMDLVSKVHLQRININLSPSIQMPTRKLQDRRVVISLLQGRKNFFRNKTQYGCLQEKVCSDCCHTEAWQSVKALVTGSGFSWGSWFSGLKELEGTAGSLIGQGTKGCTFLL